MKRYYSGSGSTSNPLGSLGGAITANVIGNATVNAVWDDVAPTEAETGDIEYRCFYLKWTGPETIYNIVMFLSSKANGPDDSVFIGKGSAAKNGTEQTIANESAIPSGVVFDNPGSRSEGFLVADSFAQGDRQSIWLKRTINQGADILNLEDYTIEVQFDTGQTGSTPTPSCPSGQHWSSSQNKCVADTVVEPPTTGTYVVGFVGDTDCGSKWESHVNSMKNKGIKLFVGCGDYAYDDSSASCWINDIKPIKDVVKVLPMGNHEVEEGADSDLYKEYLNIIGKSQQYHSYIYKNQLYIALSMFISYKSGSAQYNWCRDILQKYKNDGNIKWRIVAFHEFMYTNKSHHVVDHPSFRDTYHPLFDDNNVDIVLQGHNHCWSRSYPLSHSGGSTPTKESSSTTNYVSPFDGEIFIICGTGGKSIYDNEDHKSYMVTGSDDKYNQYGYGILEFSNNSLTCKIKFFNTSNKQIDSTTITKAT